MNRYTLRRVLLAAAAAAAAAAPVPEAARAAPPAEVRVGLLLPSDGTAALEASRGAAVAAAREAGDGVPVRVVERRARAAWGSEASEVAALACDEGVAGIVAGPDRAAAHLAAQVAVKAGVPVLATSGESGLTRIPLPWVARVAPGERRVLDALLAAVPAGERAGPWTAFVDAGREGERLAGEIRRAAARAGRRAPALVALDEGEDPPVPGGEGPVLLAASTDRAARTLRALAAADRKGTRLALPSPAGPEALEERAGAAAAGLVLPRPFDPETGPEAAAFRRAFRARFGAEPTEAAAAAHDAVRLLARAVRSSDGTPEGVRAALLSGPRFEGATGPVEFDASGERSGAVPLARARGGASPRPVPAGE